MSDSNDNDTNTIDDEASPTIATTSGGANAGSSSVQKKKKKKASKGRIGIGSAMAAVNKQIKSVKSTSGGDDTAANDPLSSLTGAARRKEKAIRKSEAKANAAMSSSSSRTPTTPAEDPILVALRGEMPRGMDKAAKLLAAAAEKEKKKKEKEQAEQQAAVEASSSTSVTSSSSKRSSSAVDNDDETENTKKPKYNFDLSFTSSSLSTSSSASSSSSSSSSFTFNFTGWSSSSSSFTSFPSLTSNSNDTPASSSSSSTESSVPNGDNSEAASTSQSLSSTSSGRSIPKLTSLVNGYTGNRSNSTKTANTVLDWLLWPIPQSTWFNDIHEKKPFHIDRKHSSPSSTSSSSSVDNNPMYHQLWSRSEFHRYIREKKVVTIPDDIDVVSCKEGKQANAAQRKLAADTVWKEFEQAKNGSSIHLYELCVHSDTAYRLVNWLEESLSCPIACSAHLWPGVENAPNDISPELHCNEFDMFVLQCEGRRAWQVYSGNTPQSFLPAVFRGGCKLHELTNSTPILSITLYPGDLLYIPRGLYYRHFNAELLTQQKPTKGKANANKSKQDTKDSKDASTSGSHGIDDMASLHIILSPKHFVWSDYMIRVLTRGVALASEQMIELRQSIPRDTHEYTGVVHSDKGDERRDQLITQFFQHLQSVVQSGLLPFDGMIDEQYRSSLHGRQPPYISDTSRMNQATASKLTRSYKSSNNAAPVPVVPQGPQIIPKQTKGVDIKGTSRIRLIRRGVARLTVEDDDDADSNAHRSQSVVSSVNTMSVARVYHGVANSRRSGSEAVSYIEFPLSYASSLERILDAYPNWISVGTLHIPIDDNDDDMDSDNDDDEKKTESKTSKSSSSSLSMDAREKLSEERAIEMITLLYNDGVIELSNDTSLPADIDIKEKLKQATQHAAQSSSSSSSSPFMSAPSSGPRGIAASVSRLMAKQKPK